MTVDIGNTAVGIAVFDKNKLFHQRRFFTPSPADPHPWSELISHWPHPGVREVIVSSVVPPLNPGFARFLKEERGVTPRFLDHESPLEVELAVDHPAEVGADRIADVVGALEFTAPPCLVIDSGTALTLDVLDADKRYLGGVIAPGVGISIRSLAKYTARLEEVDFRIPETPLARNTADCIRAGVFYTHLGGIDFLVGEYRRLVGENAAVIATGGAIELFRGRLEKVDHLVPDLIHHGLRRIHAGWIAAERW